jgi:hypothetical protein
MYIAAIDPNVRSAASKLSDADLVAMLNSKTVHEGLRTFTGPALEGLGQIVLACCEEHRERTALRALYATGGCD